MGIYGSGIIVPVNEYYLIKSKVNNKGYSIDFNPTKNTNFVFDPYIKVYDTTNVKGNVKVIRIAIAYGKVRVIPEHSRLSRNSGITIVGEIPVTKYLVDSLNIMMDMQSVIPGLTVWQAIQKRYYDYFNPSDYKEHEIIEHLLDIKPDFNVLLK